MRAAGVRGAVREEGALSSIQHIVIVLQENHTFDNYFGTYPGADDLTGREICLPVTKGSSRCVAPYHDSNLTPVDMNHSWASAHADYDGGRMDGFVYSEGNQETMGHYDASDLPRYWTAAMQYSLCDRYFTSVMSESAPNHLYLVAGTAGGLTNDNVPSSLSFTPIFQQLDESGVSWKVYGFTKWYESFAYVQSSKTAGTNFLPGTQFASDVQAGRLSEVSWIIGAPGGNEHPPANIQVGQNSVFDDVVNPVGSSGYWGSSAIFVTWDCFGGFYDHVAPPQVDRWGYGFRVACIAISPYSKAGYVDSTVYDHTSILKFVESRYGLSSLATRDAAAKPISGAFDFSQPARRYNVI